MYIKCYQFLTFCKKKHADADISNYSIFHIFAQLGPLYKIKGDELHILLYHTKWVKKYRCIKYDTLKKQ